MLTVVELQFNVEQLYNTNYPWYHMYSRLPLLEVPLGDDTATFLGAFAPVAETSRYDLKIYIFLVQTRTIYESVIITYSGFRRRFKA